MLQLNQAQSSVCLSCNLVGQRREPAVLRAALEVLAPDDVPDAGEPVRHDHERAEHQQEQRERVFQKPERYPGFNTTS